MKLTSAPRISLVVPAFNDAIEETLSDRVIVGATGITMSRASVGIALTMLVVTAATRISRTGAGVVFCRRCDWEAVGGFDESRLFAEDVWFQFALKRLGRSRAQGFALAKGAGTITSARKFDLFGDWHTFRLVGRWLLGSATWWSRCLTGCG